MNIVTAFDDNYLPHGAAMLTSLREANPKERISLYILFSGKDCAGAAKLYFYLSSIYSTVSISSVAEENIPDLPLPVGQDYISKATYIRLMLDRLLPSGISKVLYLDPDIVINGSISELWNTNMQTYPLAAITEGWQESEVDNRTRLELGDDTTYFNAGVLLIDLDCWRKRNILAEATSILKLYSERILWADQDVLNLLFKKDWLPIPEYWNFQTMHVNASLESGRDCLTQTDDEPVIIHFTGSGSRKPWDFRCSNPYRRVFLEAKEQTPWKHVPLSNMPPTTRFRIKSYFKELILSKFKKNNPMQR